MRRLVPLLERGGDNAGDVLKELGQQLVKVRVSDPDWIRIQSGQWSRIGSVLGIRIRTQVAKKTHKSRKKF
jgi:hypothetical protein